MGIGGALMWPAILGMTFAALPESKAGLAGGLILGVAGIGNAVGPLLGGALTELLDWRWIFVVNVPIAAFAMFVTWRNVHQEQELSDERIDYAGMATISGGPRLPPARPRPGRRLGLGRPSGRRDVRPLGRPDRLLRLHRATRRARAP